MATNLFCINFLDTPLGGVPLQQDEITFFFLHVVFAHEASCEPRTKESSEEHTVQQLMQFHISEKLIQYHLLELNRR